VFDITFLKIGEEFRKTNFLKSFIHIPTMRIQKEICFRILLAEILAEFWTPILLIFPPRISAIFSWLYTAPCGFEEKLL
jgi:hypothetical protein